MDYIEKLDLQTDEVKEVETLEKHIITNNKPFTVDEYEGHDRDFLAVDGDYNDGFNQLKETNGIGINCIVSKRVNNLKEEIETLYNSNLRIFKPVFGFNCLGSPCCDCKTLEEQITMFNKMIDIGVEEISLCLNIIENSDGTMYNKDDNNMIDESIRYCIDNNIKISTIHLYVNQEFNTIEDNFNTNYKNIVREVLEKYAHIDYEYLIVWNEATTRIRNPIVYNTILECMEIAKGYNKKVGISLIGVSSINYIDKSIFDKSDFICFNYYQSIGDKYDKTSVQDGINAWCNGELNDLINYANNIYPDKEVIIGESGIIGSYDCLLGPAGLPRNWATYDFNGRVCEIYYNGLFEGLKNSNIKKVYGWFPHDFVKYPEPVKKILSKYLRGGK